MSEWTHDSLLEDLAAYLRAPDRMVWTDMQLGPSGSPRPDVYTLQKSYSKPQPSAFEIKISRSDLRSDTTSGKWQTYLRFAGAVTFAVPDGLCTAADIPESCGLIVRKAAVWRYVRKPTRQAVILPSDAYMKLLIDGVSRVSVRSPLPGPRTAVIWKDNEIVRKKFGDAVARAARDLVGVERSISSLQADFSRQQEEARRKVAAYKDDAMGRAKQAVAEYEVIKREILEWLDLGEDAGLRTVRGRIATLKANCDADSRVRVADQNLGCARSALQNALHALGEPDVVTPAWRAA